jgi:hypothetical protein
MRFLFVLVIIFILILSCRKHLAHFQFFRLKKKIKNNPSIGIKQEDNSYNYKQGGYTVSYKVKGPPSGLRVEWLYFKRRLTFIEKKILEIKRSLDKFFLYQRWAVLLRPSVIGVLLVALTVLYLGVKDQPAQRIGRFKWIIAQVAGINPEAIEYAGAGWFNVSGQRRSVDGGVEPVKISFNFLSQLFSPGKANVSFWNKRLKKHINYSMDINDTGDVWLDKKNQQIHGRVMADKIVWDQPQSAGIKGKVSGHQFTVQDGKLNISDE